jgi:hypothetical protein
MAQPIASVVTYGSSAVPGMHQSALGGDKKINFWHDRWIVGQAPSSIALVLYKLAWCKNISVEAATTDEKWMNGLRCISTTEEVS